MLRGPRFPTLLEPARLEVAAPEAHEHLWELYLSVGQPV